MQLCDKASARQPRATFVLLASQCAAAGGGRGVHVLSSLMFKPLIIPGHHRFGHRFSGAGGSPQGAELNWVWGAGA